MRVGYRAAVRSVVDFYRARPMVGILVFAIGLAVAVATTALQDGDGVVLPIAFVALVGLLVGSVLALAQRRRRDRAGGQRGAARRRRPQRGAAQQGRAPRPRGWRPAPRAPARRSGRDARPGRRSPCRQRAGAAARRGPRGRRRPATRARGRRVALTTPLTRRPGTSA